MLSDEPLDETKKIPVSLEKKRRKSGSNFTLLTVALLTLI
jgi:hypothetical protein